MQRKVFLLIGLCLLVLTDTAFSEVWTEHLVDENFDGARFVCAADIDGDGDIDALGSSLSNDSISWWKNTDGIGKSWTKHLVVDNYDGVMMILADDIDGDGDLDIVSAEQYRYDITWWENTDGSGTSWTEHIIDDVLINASRLAIADINGDGYMDVIGAGHVVRWYENTNGSGTSWIQHSLDNHNGFTSLIPIDIDFDGDMDIVGSDVISDYITWWENTDGSGTSWTEHIIDDTGRSVHFICVVDIDRDNDLDVLGSEQLDDRISWWENSDGSGTSWTKHLIDNNVDGAYSLVAADIDNDGDTDALGASLVGDYISWWENTDGIGTSWTEHLVDDNVDVFSVCDADIDDDGKSDVLIAAIGTGDIVWYENPRESVDFNISNVPGGAIGLQGIWRIDIYNTIGESIRQISTKDPASAIAYLEDDDYLYDVFFLSDDGLGVIEKWGSGSFTVAGSPLQINFTRNMPWLGKLTPWMPTLSCESTLTVTVQVTNELPQSINVKVQGQIAGGDVLSSNEVTFGASTTGDVVFVFNDLPGDGVWPLKYWILAKKAGENDFAPTDHCQFDGYLTIEDSSHQGSEYFCLDYRDEENNIWQLGLDYLDKTNTDWFYAPKETFKNLKFYKNGFRINPTYYEKQILLKRIARQFDCIYPLIVIGDEFDPTYGIWRQPCGFSWACGLALTDFDDSERKTIYKDLIFEAVTCRNYPYLNTEYKVPSNNSYVAGALSLKTSLFIDELWEQYCGFISDEIDALDYVKKMQYIAEFYERDPNLKEQIKSESKSLDKLMDKLVVAEKVGGAVLHTLQNIALMDFLSSSGFAEERIATLKEAYYSVYNNVSNQIDPMLEQAILEVETEFQNDLENIGSLVLSSFLQATFGELDDPNYVKQQLINLAAGSKLARKAVGNIAKSLKLSKAAVASAVMEGIKGLTTVMDLGDDWRRIILSGMLSKVVVLYAQNDINWQTVAYPQDGVLTADLLDYHQVRDVYDLQSVFASEYLNRGLNLVKSDWNSVWADAIDSTLEQATSPPYTYPINYASTAAVLGKTIGQELNGKIYSDSIEEAKEMVSYILEASSKKNIAINQWAEMFAEAKTAMTPIYLLLLDNYQ